MASRTKMTSQRDECCLRATDSVAENIILSFNGHLNGLSRNYKYSRLGDGMVLNLTQGPDAIWPSNFGV